MRSALFIILLLWLAPFVAAAEPDVLVLDAADSGFMQDALKRIGCPFDHAASVAGSHRIVILCGKEVRADEKKISEFLQKGGSILAVGAGAQWMIDSKLFDATSYTPAGTTIHQSVFDGYHRLIFGYPEAKPLAKWITGVPMLLRATEGPLLRLGPRATSILAAGGPFSLAAFQRIGRGMALIIGPDPQGGNEFLSLTKATPRLGDELHTDMLLENAIFWLREPDCNIIPNPGFESGAGQASEMSHWEVGLNNRATSEWVKTDAPEGAIYLRMIVPSGSSATVTPFIPIAVEPGAGYRFSCLYKCAAGATFMTRHLVIPNDDISKLKQHNIPVPPSGEWARFEAQLQMPKDCHYLKLNLFINTPGDFSVDDITLRAAW